MGESFLYSYPRKIHLLLDCEAQPNWNYPMQSPEFKLYRNVDNEVEFYIRDTDRKPVNLQNSRLKFTAIDFRENNTLWEIDLDIVNPTKGLVRLNVVPYLLSKVKPESYAFYVTMIRDSKEKLFYTDHRNSARGFFEVLEGKYPAVRPTIVMDPETFIDKSSSMLTDRWLTSSYYPGNLQTAQDFDLMTLAVYGENFDGWIWVEGSLEYEPTDQDFFNIPLNGQERTLFSYWSGIKSFSLPHKVFWLRVNYKNNLSM